MVILFMFLNGSAHFIASSGFRMAFDNQTISLLDTKFKCFSCSQDSEEEDESCAEVLEQPVEQAIRKSFLGLNGVARSFVSSANERLVHNQSSKSLTLNENQTALHHSAGKLSVASQTVKSIDIPKSGPENVGKSLVHAVERSVYDHRPSKEMTNSTHSVEAPNSAAKGIAVQEKTTARQTQWDSSEEQYDSIQLNRFSSQKDFLNECDCFDKGPDNSPACQLTYCSKNTKGKEKLTVFVNPPADLQQALLSQFLLTMYIISIEKDLLRKKA
jgi:hypothetical protein